MQQQHNPRTTAGISSENGGNAQTNDHNNQQKRASDGSNQAKWPIRDNNAQQGQKTSKWAEFMKIKERKLHQQIHERVLPKTNIFAGVSCHINGYTDPPFLELRDLIVQNGGEFHHYWNPRKTKYMLATNLATTKWKTLGKNAPSFVVQPKWIVDSIREGKRLPVTKYLLIHKQRVGIRDGHQQCAGASILYSNGEKGKGGGGGTQLSIYDFTNFRRRRHLFENLYKKKVERRKRWREGRQNEWEKEMEAIREWQKEREGKAEMRGKNGNIERNQRANVAATQPPWKFEYGHVRGERHQIFVGNVRFDYTKGAQKAHVQQLVAIYKCKMNDPDWPQPAIQFSLNFLGRLIGGDEITKAEKEAGLEVHSDWPVVLDLLRKWIANSEQKIQEI